MVKSIKKILKRLLITCMLTIHVLGGMMTVHALDWYIEPFEIRQESITYKEDLPNVEDIINIDKIGSSKQSILIYSSHGGVEKYSDGVTVIKTAEKLKSELEKQGFAVEHIDNEFSLAKGYNKSYLSSREVIKDIAKNYDLVLDLHIDASNSSKAMFVTCNDINYYKDQQKVIEGIRANMDSKYVKDTYTYNNVIKNKSFNLDLSKNSILIELGGNTVSSKDIKSTLDSLSNGISTYLKNLK